MQKFPGSSKLLPIFESKMSDMTIFSNEKDKQTHKLFTTGLPREGMG